VIYKQIDTIGLYEIIPGFILATLAIIVVTLLSPPPSAVAQNTVDKVAEDRS
jgi:sodium/proline symporter